MYVAFVVVVVVIAVDTVVFLEEKRDSNLPTHKHSKREKKTKIGIYEYCNISPATPSC
jgi:hypothetical protein